MSVVRALVIVLAVAMCIVTAKRIARLLAEATESR